MLPSTAGDFSVKATHRLLRHMQGTNHTTVDRQKWKIVWNLNIHNRHKLLIWKLLHNILPTLARIQNYIPVVSQECYLCQSEVESLRHLLLHCPLTKSLWWNSPWNLRIDHFQDMQADEWFSAILDIDHALPIDVGEKIELLQFFVISFEQIWLERNNVGRQVNIRTGWRSLLLQTNYFPNIGHSDSSLTLYILTRPLESPSEWGIENQF